MKINTGIREVYIPPLHYKESQQLTELFKVNIPKFSNEIFININL